jgi:prevent-host-death family protein
MVKKLSIKHVIGATEVRNNFGKYLNRVHRGEEHLVVEKLGIPVAAVISIQEYEQYRRLLAARLHQDLDHQVGAEYERQGISEEQFLETMEEDRETVAQLVERQDG